VKSHFISISLLAALILPALPLFSADAPPASVPPSVPAVPAGASDELIARAACSACHLFPHPSLLDRTVWPEHIFPKMRLYMGMDKIDLNASEDARRLTKAGFFPAAPMIPESSWNRITNWYVAKAPAPTNTPSRNALIPIGMANFKILAAKNRHDPPLTTLVQINPQDRVIFAADATSQTLDVLTPAGELLGRSPVGNILTTLQRSGPNFYAGAIGHFFPNEEPRGQVMFLKRIDRGFERHVLFSDLPRIAHLELADLNSDGQDDFALSMFGFLTGRFSWFESLGEMKFKEHILYNKPGAVKSIAYDFNQDGHLDLAALFGQETDGLLLFTGDGKGNFKQSDIFRRAPTFGHSYFELADFDKDGAMDILVVNGDNADYESPPKPYHGVRIYLNKSGKFEESYFFPQHGAFKAVARDFDADGDLDIASASFFPDYQKSPRESFVYLENKGDLKFEPSTFRQCIGGRWLTIDAGDMDGDGDIDIALGSMIGMTTTTIPDFLKDLWKKQSPSVLFLVNQLK
jgi:hypothetical protein